MKRPTASSSKTKRSGRAVRRRRGSWMKRSRLIGHAHQRLHGAALLAGKLQGEREAEIGDERKRMRRVDRERRQHREDRIEEIALEPAAARPRSARPARRSRCRHRPARRAASSSWRAAAAPVRRPWRRSARSCSAGDSPSSLTVAISSRAWPGEAGDAHHDELVEVLARDRQEAQPLEQRMVGVLRFLQHAPVELQPGNLAVDEARRARGKLRVQADGRLARPPSARRDLAGLRS